MNAKEKAIKYLKYNTTKDAVYIQSDVEEAIDIAIFEAKKEVFDDIDECIKFNFGTLWLNEYPLIKKKHLLVRK